MKKNYSNLNTNYNNLNSKYTKCESNYNSCQSNYNSCKNQLSYYINLSSQITPLKEQITSLNYDLNQCYNNLNQCYNDYYVEYDKITDQMKKTIQELIVVSYQRTSNFEQRAKYVSDRMTEIYNKAYWSCVIGKSYYGYYVWYVNDLYYTYRYKNIDWIVFVGVY